VKLRLRFGLEKVVFVGDRGTLTGAKVRELRECVGLGWITALRSEGIRKLVEGCVLQMSLFDDRDLAEIESPDYPGERLVACYNPFLAEERARKREELLKATETCLKRIESEVARSRRPKAATIGLKVGKVVNRFKVAKHFDIEIKEGFFTFARNEASIRLESELDGIYVLRTSEPAERMSAEDTVRSYKMLSEVEKAFRCLKGADLRVRPIFHRTEEHVRAHFFLCMLAYYVEWHMRQALAPLLYQDEELPRLRPLRDPVKRPEPSPSAKGKKGRGKSDGGFPVHSFSTLLTEMATQSRVRYRVGNSETTFDQLAPPTPLQQRAFELLGL
jgi:transposase